MNVTEKLMNNVEISVGELLAVIGEKEMELRVERNRLAKASELLKAQQAKIVELEAKIAELQKVKGD